MHKHVSLFLLVGAFFLSTATAFGAEIEVDCRETDFAEEPAGGGRSAYKELAQQDKRILHWLIAVRDRQKNEGGTVRVPFCHIIQPYPDQNGRTADGYRTVIMYDDYFDEAKNEFVRQGMKFVYSRASLANGRRERKVEAYADCATTEACVRVGIYARAPIPARQNQNTERKSLQPLDSNEDPLARPPLPLSTPRDPGPALEEDPLRRPAPAPLSSVPLLTPTLAPFGGAQ